MRDAIISTMRRPARLLYRSRTHPVFSASRPPALGQVFIDRMQLTVKGTWAAPNDVSANEWLIQSVSHPECRWLTQISPSQKSTNYKTLASAETTLKNLRLNFYDVHQGRGNFKIGVDLNPTRTTAHLLKALPEDAEEEASVITDDRIDHFFAHMSAAEFFGSVDGVLGAQGGVPVTLDGNDNWIGNPKRAASILGPYQDRFPRLVFLKFRSFINQLLGTEGAQAGNGGTDFLEANGGHFTVDWGGLHVPQIETYFDVAHPKAVVAVQRGGMTALAGDHSTAVRLVTLERHDRAVRVLSSLARPYSLSVYAKARNCIRFEVARNGKGDYRSIGRHDNPADRFAGIVRHEREQFLRRVRWEAEFDLYSGPDQYNRFDLRDLLEAIWRAVGSNMAETFGLIDKLIIQGGVCDSDMRSVVRTRLLRAGIIQQQKIRPREINGKGRRYILKPPYRDIVLDLQLPKTATKPATNRPLDRSRRVRISAI